MAVTLPTQSVPSLAQQNVPGVPNNGNPNTVYNTPAGAWGATGGWNTTTVSPAANFMPMDVQPVGWAPPAGSAVQQQPFAVLPDGWNIPTGGGTVTPPVLPPVQPPIVQPPTGDPPPKQPPPVSKPPKTGRPGGGSGTHDSFDGWTGGPGNPTVGERGGTPGTGTFSGGGSINDLTNVFKNAGLDTGGFGDWLASTGIGNKLGFNADGSIDLAQIADWFVPGDVYQNGQFNWGNGLAAAASKFFGLPIKSIMNLLSNTSAVRNSDSWLGQTLNAWKGQNNANRMQNGVDQSTAGLGDTTGLWNGAEGGDTAFGFGSYGDGLDGWQGPSPGDGSATSEYTNWLNSLGKGLDAVGDSGGGNAWGSTVLTGQGARDYAAGLQRANFDANSRQATMNMFNKIKIK